MQHVIRIERDPETDRPWIGTGDGGFLHPDDAATDSDLPLALARVNKRLEDALDPRPATWTVTLQSHDGDLGPLLGYGRRFVLRGEGAPRTLTFTHVVVLEGRDHVYPAAKAVLRVLADAGLAELTRRLTAVAAGSIAPEVFCCWIAKRLEDRTSLASGAGKVFALDPLDRIDVIDHDCAGASGVAWLTMACVMNGAPGPWEVYDTGGGRGGSVVTTLEPGGEGIRARAADLISRGMAAVMKEQAKKSKARAAAAPPTPAPVPVPTPTPAPSPAQAPAPAPRSKAPVPVQRRKAPGKSPGKSPGRSPGSGGARRSRRRPGR